MIRTILGMSCIAILWVFCAPISAQPRELGPPKVVLPREAIGVGDTTEKAKESARQKAEETVATLMKLHNLNTFKVDRSYLEKHVLAKSAGRQGEDHVFDGQAPLKEWIVSFRTDHDWWSDIVRHDRAEARQGLVSRAMIGLSILLLAGFGYLRLDEYTHRRYTTWLRAAGVALVATAIAGWWLVV